MSNINKIKRGLIVLCIFLLGSLFIFINTKNQPKEQTYEEIVEDIKSYKTYNSYDNIFLVKAPSTWNEVEDKNSLNENAILELHNSKTNAYLVAIVTNKLDVEDSFEIFKKDVFTQKENHYGIKINEYKDVVVDGYNSQYIEFYNTNEDHINTYIRSYAIETKNYYVQIMLWTLKSNEELVGQEFDNIIDNFKEI